MDEIIIKTGKIDGISDLHLQSDQPLSMRVNGSIIKDTTQSIAAKDINDFIKAKLSQDQFDHLEEHKGVDLALVVGDIRFRVNIYSATNGCNIVMRKIETKVPDFYALNFLNR